MPRRHHDPKVESLRAALTSLRTRSGLTVDRLHSTGLRLSPLSELDVVQQVERTQQLSPEEAIVAVVRGAAAQLDVADLLIVDAALALGVVAESFPDGPDLEDLYAPDLSERREALVASWSTLHEVVGAPSAGRTPTVRALRTELESRAFERLAERIVAASPLDASAEGQAPLLTAEVTRPGSAGAPAARNGTGPRVVVVGGAVMDYIYAVDHVPQPGTAVQATSYQHLPGGKGLNQAVAAARLGMDVHLVATVGEDDAGNQVLACLEREGVHTDLVRVVPRGTTAVTNVIVTPDGTASTIGWLNQGQIGVTVRDVWSLSVQAALQEAGTVMLTFELPRDTIDAVLDTTANAPAKPTTVLTPSPPYEGASFAREILRNVDYLVGTQWELGCLLPVSPPQTDQLLTQLLVLGVGTVCLAESFGCIVRSNTRGFEIPSVPTAFKEAPGARDAFAAALARRLHDSKGRLDESGAAWATAAMAAPQSFGGAASSMPTREEIDGILQLASPRTGDMGDR